MNAVLLQLDTSALADEAEESAEIEYLDGILAGWAEWVRENPANLAPVTCLIGRLLKVAEHEPRPGTRIVSEGQCLAIDKAVARLATRLRRVVFVEYFRDGGSEHKARYMGLKRIQYRERLKMAQASLNTALQPDIDDWRQNSL